MIKPEEIPRIWPDLINGRHIVSLYDLRRVHGDKTGCELWALAVSKNQRLKINNRDWVFWDFYNSNIERIVNEATV